MATEVNKRMEELLHGDNHWLAGAVMPIPKAALVIGGITSEEEEEQLDELNQWMNSQVCSVAFSLLSLLIRKAASREQYLILFGRMGSTKDSASR